MFISKYFQSNATHSVTTATNNETAKKAVQPSQVLGNVKTVKNTPESLIGKTIHPRYASKTLNKVSYDGQGKILSFKQALRPKEYDKLASKVISSLATTPTNAKTTIRTPQECLLKIASVIKKNDTPHSSKQNILANIRNIFLSGYVTPASIHALHHSLQRLLPSHSDLLMEVNEAVASLEKEFYITKHNDNYYGRLFETELAQKIVDNPSQEMKKNTEMIKCIIIDDFQELSHAAQKHLCKDILQELEHDPATWRSEIPEVKAYIKKSTPDNLLRMVNSDSELKDLLIMHLAVKYLHFSPSFDKMMGKASEIYFDVIEPQRKLERTLNNDIVKSSRTGIQLHYQVRSEPTEATGERPIDRYRPLVNDITAHNRLALIAERPVAIGMSGSSHILNQLFVVMNEHVENFDIDHARLFAAALLTHSGGHSFNEAFTVFDYADKKSFEPITYSSLGKNDPYANAAITHAYDKMIETAMAL